MTMRCMAARLRRDAGRIPDGLDGISAAINHDFFFIGEA